MRSLRGIGLMAAVAGLAMAAGPAIEDVPRQRGRQRVETRPTYHKSPKLNRSRHWAYAETYEEARALAPMPHCMRPVR